MSTVASPVTQIVDTAVNRASLRGVTVRDADAIGSENSAVNSRIRLAKMRIAKRDGDEVMRRRTKCHSPRARVPDDVDQPMLDITSLQNSSASADARVAPSLRHGTPAAGRLT